MITFLLWTSSPSCSPLLLTRHSSAVGHLYSSSSDGSGTTRSHRSGKSGSPIFRCRNRCQHRKNSSWWWYSSSWWDSLSHIPWWQYGLFYEVLIFTVEVWRLNVRSDIIEVYEIFKARSLLLRFLWDLSLSKTSDTGTSRKNLFHSSWSESDTTSPGSSEYVDCLHSGFSWGFSFSWFLLVLSLFRLVFGNSTYGSSRFARYFHPKLLQPPEYVHVFLEKSLG